MTWVSLHLPCCHEVWPAHACHPALITPSSPRAVVAHGPPHALHEEPHNLAPARHASETFGVPVQIHGLDCLVLLLVDPLHATGPHMVLATWVPSKPHPLPHAPAQCTRPTCHTPRCPSPGRPRRGPRTPRTAVRRTGRSIRGSRVCPREGGSPLISPTGPWSIPGTGNSSCGTPGHRSSSRPAAPATLEPSGGDVIGFWVCFALGAAMALLATRLHRLAAHEARRGVRC